MTTTLTIAQVEVRIADYQLIVERWLDGGIDDDQLKECGDYLLFYDSAGVEQAAEILEQSKSSATWKQLCDDWNKACYLHAKLSDTRRDMARAHHVGGDSVSNLRRLYYGFISGMSLEQIEPYYEQLNLPAP